MGFEIEHKYRVKDDSYKSLATKVRHIRQGYLSRDPERTVRIRTVDDKGYVTIKGITRGDIRHEYEYEVPHSDAEEMLDMCIPPLIEKYRYIVRFGNHNWEVDEFEGDLSGLVMAEIELSTCGESYEVPSFAGENVTGNPKYYNSNLHTISLSSGGKKNPQ